MKPRASNDADLLDRFMQSFARLDDLTWMHDEPLPDLLSDGIDPDDWTSIRWRPVKLDSPRTAMSSIRRVGALPNLFELLAASYCWLTVDLGVCRLFSNPPTEDLQPFADAMFADPALNKILLPARLVRFALAPNECYDPICFDLTQMIDGDCPIVRLEHESILMHDRIGGREALFGSFRELVEAVITSADANI